MMNPKISTTISKLLIGDYFIPDGETAVYQLHCYDSDWELWEGYDDLESNLILFDDMPCVWLPCYELKS